MTAFHIELRLRVDRTWQPASVWASRIDELVTRYAAEEHLRCCSMQGGFFIDVDGAPWSDASTVDEFWMTQGFIRALDAILRGAAHAACAPGPWEESRLRLERSGAELVMEDVHHSGRVSMPRVSVDLRAFALAMAPEAEMFCRILEDLSTAARLRGLDVVVDNTRIDPPNLIERVREWPALAQ